MGKRGPKKKLAQLENMEGNPGKRKVMAPTISATGEPFVPDHLHSDAQACIELIKKLMPPGVYGAVDGFALSGYATAWAWHKRAVHEMNHPKFKPLVKGASGQDTPNPWFRILREQNATMMAWGDRLGLDPKSRQSLQMIDGDKAKRSKFDGLMGASSSTGGKTKRVN